jgi:hypothetical protein
MGTSSVLAHHESHPHLCVQKYMVVHQQTTMDYMRICLLCCTSRAWLCWVEEIKLRVCTGDPGNIGGASILSSPRVLGQAHFTLFLIHDRPLRGVGS